MCGGAFLGGIFLGIAITGFLGGIGMVIWTEAYDLGKREGGRGG
jgi:hypothetical protein